MKAQLTLSDVISQPIGITDNNSRTQRLVGAGASSAFGAAMGLLSSFKSLVGIQDDKEVEKPKHRPQR